MNLNKWYEDNTALRDAPVKRLACAGFKHITLKHRGIRHQTVGELHVSDIKLDLNAFVQSEVFILFPFLVIA